MNRRHLEEFPDRAKMMKAGKFKEATINYEELIDKQINQAKEERPAVLRSNVVDKYIIDILQ